MAILSF